jgi:hypothetical protein
VRTPRGGAAAARTVVYARGTAKLAAGATKKVRATLTAAGRRALRGRKRLAVLAIATVSGGDAARATVTLTR